ncbi:MAG TPA: GH25 family lysozyme [Nitrospira sp.]|nr:GH25 family lysozyme [Nitrospira sp.]
MSAQGEDRSNFQPVVPPVDRNGKKLDFVIYKATEGTNFVDPTYRANIAMAKAHGVPFGSYHFLHPSLDIPTQITLFMATVAENGGLEPGAMLFADSEISAGANGRLMLSRDRSELLVREPESGKAHIRDGVDYPHHMLAHGSPTTLAASLVDLHTRQFIIGVRTAVEVALGGDYCQEGVYSFLNMLHQLPSCTDFPLWAAYFSSTAPPSVNPWTNWAIWQYAGGGGNGGSDQDGFNGGVAQFESWRTAKMTASVPQWEVSMLNALPMIGKGAQDAPGKVFFVSRAQALAKVIGTVNSLPAAASLVVDGNFDTKTEVAIRAVQTHAGFAAKDIDGIVGPMTWGVLVTGSPA